ncbi:Phosphate acyltransferase [subsurface metagenome]
MPEVSKRVRIAVDGMGGDYAPGEIVKGAVYAVQKGGVEVILTGPLSILEGELAKYGSSDNLPIRCVEASEVIKEGESPALAIRHKHNSSIVIATKLVKTGEADAVVSAGSTGATAVSAIVYLGMIEGLERPAVAAPFKGLGSNVIVIDIGGNVDCKPHQFLSFAIAGSIYARKLFNIANPTVGLLSTGVEEGKGSESIREGYLLLKNSGLNFVGNVEGSDILSGRANVVVCDGLVGNVLIKFYQSLGNYAVDFIKRKLKKYPLSGRIVNSLFNRLFPIAKLAYEGEEAGGGILWGVDGVVRITHGNCRAPHIAYAIASAKNSVEADVVGYLKSELAKIRAENKL